MTDMNWMVIAVTSAIAIGTWAISVHKARLEGNVNEFSERWEAIAPTTKWAVMLAVMIIAGATLINLTLPDVPDCQTSYLTTSHDTVCEEDSGFARP